MQENKRNSTDFQQPEQKRSRPSLTTHFHDCFQETIESWDSEYQFEQKIRNSLKNHFEQHLKNQ